MLTVFHRDVDLFIRDAKKGTQQRLIYAEPQPLSEEEESQVEVFRQFLDSLNYRLP